MRRRWRRGFVVNVCAVVGATVAALSLWSPPGDHVRTADQNGDGRPDIWRTYNRHGQLLRIAVDTNFDGRSDVQEYYERGTLVRRESDRDFNDRIDLVQDFDPTSHEQVRAELDVDFDGTADLLVVFRGRQPVVWKYQHPDGSPELSLFSTLTEKTSHRSANDRLASLEDPFRADLSVSAAHPFSVDHSDDVGLSLSRGLPASDGAVGCRLACSSLIPRTRVSVVASAHPVRHSPRGPPASARLA